MTQVRVLSILNGSTLRPPERNRQARGVNAALLLTGLAGLVILVAGFSMTAGASDASAGAVIMHWFGLGAQAVNDRDLLIIEAIRLPRIVLGLLVGAALAVSGVLMQGIFRNPLADPGLAGVSAAASLGAATVIVLGSSLALPVTSLLGLLSLPVAAFFSSLAVTVLLYALATRNGRTSVPVMLLAGVAIAALAFAVTGFLVQMADDRQLRDLSFWQLGSLGGVDWPKIAVLAAIMALAFSTLPVLGPALNALALGEAAAHHMGVPVERVKRLAIVVVSAVTGASVALSGGIGFVGIVVPHILRLAIGPDHRLLLPASALLGGALLVLADTFARTIVAPAELPIGIVTALAGSPFFLWLLIHKRSVLDG